jgi:hypothetical protein
LSETGSRKKKSQADRLGWTGWPIDVAMNIIFGKVSKGSVRWEGEVRSVSLFNEVPSLNLLLVSRQPDYCVNQNDETALKHSLFIEKKVKVPMYNWWKYIPSWTKQIIVLLHQGILSMTNYMFRPSGGHHQVLYKFVKRKHAILHFSWFWDLRPS